MAATDKVEKIKLNTRDDSEDCVAPRWWKAKTPSDRALSLKAKATALQQDDTLRLRGALLHTRLYQNVQLDSLYRYNVGRGSNTRPGDESSSKGLGHKVTFNVVRSCIDTACAKISKNKPRVSFVTQKGNWESKKRAKGLTSYVDGLFYQTDFYNKTSQVFRDACVYGTGAIKLSVDAQDGTIHAERVLVFELFTDDAESIYGSPRSLYHIPPRNRDELVEAYGDTPEKRFAIETARGIADFSNSGRGESDMVNVVEAWHLPSGPRANDGRHTIAIEGVELFSEKWTYNWFPIFLFHWCEPLVGMWGQGIAEELTGIQLEISKTLRTIQRAQHLAGGLRVFVEKNSDVTVAQINNEIGEILKYRGTVPIFDSVSRTVPPELYAHLENLVQKAYALTGISQLSANAQKPPGLDAGVAIREMYDIESERFVKVGQRWEKYHVDIGRAMIELTARLFVSRPSLKVKAPGSKFLETIAWNDVRLKEDEFEMRPFPTSSLPTTPAYRFQQITEWKKANIIDQEQMMQLLDMPDLEQFTSLYTASINDIERCLDAIVERGEYQAPEPFMDLKRCTKMALSVLMKGREDGLSERRQELILRWMDEAQSLLQTGQAPTVASPPPAPPALPAMPPGAPMDPALMPGLAPAIPPTSNIPALATEVAAVPPPIAGAGA